MADLISMLSAASGATAEADPNFKQTVLLLHGDGTNGAQNNTFLDSSTNNFTITRNGNTTQGTFSPFSVGAGEWSNYFDGSGDDLELSSAVSLTGDYTIEAWVYKPTSPKGMILGNTSTNNQFSINATQNVEIYNGTTYASTGTINLNTWNHVAVSRAGSTLRFFINGTLSGSHTDSGNLSFNVIGELLSGLDRYTGYLSNVRVVSGTALYTASFTVPTTPLTAVSGTQLLTCQSNRFVDNSSSPKTFTRNGDVRVTPFSPFAPTAAYSAGTNGGSGYFDGTGDMLETPSISVGTSIFCFECWLYPTVTQGANTGIFVADSTNGLQLSYYDGASPGGLGIAQKGVAWQVFNNTGVKPIVGQWNHVAFVRSGTGTNETSIFLNGSRIANGTVSYNYASSLYELSTTNAAGTVFQGYIAGARLTLGSTPYDATQTTLTIPTAPPTAITNTSLLLNFTNAGILDNTGKNNLETVDNVQIDTGTKKYGTGSLEFDGTGDWLLMPNNPDQQLGTGNFTIEFWVYLASGDTGSARGLVAKGGASTGWLVSLDSSQKVVFTYTTSTITSSGAITTNAWNHIAVVRSGTGSNQTKIYIGGTNDGTGTVSTDFNQTESMYVGANRTGGDPMKGFIDDLRITKGIARYTANFSVPGSAFPDQ